MAALMTSVLDNAGQIAGYIADCKDMGIAVLPPDINRSLDVFSVENDGIRFGLAEIKNVGRGLMKKLVAERDRGGLFTSLEDLCRRMSEMDLNKRAVENLIKCGAMDCFGAKRSQLMQVFELVMDTVAENNRRNLAGQMGLFELEPSQAAGTQIPLPDIAEISLQDKMLLEKETTGLYLSGHPMDAYRAQLARTHVAQLAQVVGEEPLYGDNDNVTVAGIVQTVRLKTTRNNSMMAYVTLEDDTASVELLVFANALNQYGGWLKENQGVIVSGRVSIRDEKEPQIILNRAQPLADLTDPVVSGAARDPHPDDGRTELAAQAPRKDAVYSKLYLRIPSEDSPEFQKTRAILSMFPGKVPTVLFFADTSIRRGTSCAPEAVMLDELRRVLGDGSVVTK